MEKKMKQLLIVVSKAFALLQYSRTREMEKKNPPPTFVLVSSVI